MYDLTYGPNLLFTLTERKQRRVMVRSLSSFGSPQVLNNGTKEPHIWPFATPAFHSTLYGEITHGQYFIIYLHSRYQTALHKVT